MATIDKSKFQFVKRDDFASETIDAPAYSYWKSVMRQFLKKKSTITMLGILIAIILMSFIYPMFSNFDFNDVSKVNDFSMRYIKPSAQYWFGTDSNGKSLFDGVWFGARNSILISVIATFINIVVGAIAYQFLIWGVIALGFNTNYLRLYSAVILAVCLMIPTLKNKFFKGAKLSK